MWAVRGKQQQRQWPWLIGLSWDLLYLFVYFGIPVNGTQSLMHHLSLTNALTSQHVGNFRKQKVMFYPESLFPWIHNSITFIYPVTLTRQLLPLIKF